METEGAHESCRNLCEVCCQEEHKYKCPKCKLKYCSVKCYQVHTENPCGIAVNPGAEQPFIIDRQGMNATPTLDDEPDIVPEVKLKRLGANKDVLEFLGNPHLRKIIESISTSEEKATDNLIHKAMMEPIFTEFVDRCLKVVETDSEMQIDSNDADSD